MNRKIMVSAVVLLVIFCAGQASAVVLTDMEKLGGLIYRDQDLSINQNQACMTCHHPAAGFADPVNRTDPFNNPVSEGSIAGLFGGRNAPSAAYAGFSPVFGWDDLIQGYVGGMFWDGRATGWTLGDPLAEQAQGPFLNPVEMAMGEGEFGKQNVVATVAASHYAALFLKVFGPNAFADVSVAYDNIAYAIAAFERSRILVRFNSRFDAFWAACKAQNIPVSEIGKSINPADAPQSILTRGELKGLALFNDPDKGNCAACHPTTDYIYEDKIYPPLFTDFTYDNLGIPVNSRIAELRGEPQAVDYGLGGRSDIAANDPLVVANGLGGWVTVSAAQAGKFKVPTLRNVARTAPYGHNGYFPTLSAIMSFYNTRDAAGAGWDLPEVSLNLNSSELGNLKLTVQEERAIVAFMRTLTDCSK